MSFNRDHFFNSAEPAERFIGSIISLSLALSFIYWIYSDVHSLIGIGNPAICWPFFRECESWRFLTSEENLWLFITCIGISIGNCVLFCYSKSLRLCILVLIILSGIKYFIIFSDYRLRLNQHYMALWFTMGFIFFKQSLPVLRSLVILFYFFAGILKLNSEWLSGSSLYEKPWPFDGYWLIVACWYVVVLELAVIWGLLSIKKNIVLLVLGQLFIFHLLSFSVVGFFYPLLMYILLMIFFLPNKKKITKPNLAFLLFFVVLQIVPYLSKGDSAVTGQGRLLALHMFDNNLSCEASLNISFNNNRKLKELLNIPVSRRIKCDPILYLHVARDVCSRKELIGFNSLDLSLVTKKPLDNQTWSVIDIKDFCQKDPSYNVIGFNDWISYTKI